MSFIIINCYYCYCHMLNINYVASHGSRHKVSGIRALHSRASQISSSLQHLLGDCLTLSVPVCLLSFLKDCHHVPSCHCIVKIFNLTLQQSGSGTHDAPRWKSWRMKCWDGLCMSHRCHCSQCLLLHRGCIGLGRRPWKHWCSLLRSAFSIPKSPGLAPAGVVPGCLPVPVSKTGWPHLCLW